MELGLGKGRDRDRDRVAALVAGIALASARRAADPMHGRDDERSKTSRSRYAAKEARSR